MSSVSRDTSHIEKFNGTNFPQWKYGVFLLLEQHDLMSLVEGTVLIPTEIKDENGTITNKDEIGNWKQRDVTARNFLYATTNTQHQRALVNCKTAREMWVKLSTQYLQKAAENKHLLQDQFFKYEYHHEHKVMDHITAIESMASSLDDLGAPMTELQVISKIVCTLPPSFRHFMSAWDNVPEQEKTLATLTARLLKEESMNALYNDAETNKRDLAFFSKQNRGGRSVYTQNPHQQGTNKKNPKGKPFCNVCKKYWHTAENCRVRIKHEQEKRERESLEVEENDHAK